MNPLIHGAAQSMDPGAGVVMGLMTAAFMALFLAWTWYAYAPSRRAVMQAYGRLPFLDDEGDA